MTITTPGTPPPPQPPRRGAGRTVWALVLAALLVGAGVLIGLVTSGDSDAAITPTSPPAVIQPADGDAAPGADAESEVAPDQLPSMLDDLFGDELDELPLEDLLGEDFNLEDLNPEDLNLDEFLGEDFNLDEFFGEGFNPNELNLDEFFGEDFTAEDLNLDDFQMEEFLGEDFDPQIIEDLLGDGFDLQEFLDGLNLELLLDGSEEMTS